ncbi:MAG: hypothetical protein AB1483_08970 [Candidatus Zixiibacteriota bacterium]
MRRTHVVGLALMMVVCLVGNAGVILLVSPLLTWGLLYIIPVAFTIVPVASIIAGYKAGVLKRTSLFPRMAAYCTFLVVFGWCIWAWLFVKNVF